MLHSEFSGFVSAIAPVMATKTVRVGTGMGFGLIREAVAAKMRTFRKALTPQRYVFHYEHMLGTSFELQLVANDANAAHKAEAAALDEIDRLSAILSGYSTTSELSQWLLTANEFVPVSSELADVLEAAELWRVKTDGAFNAAAVAIAQGFQVSQAPLWVVDRARKSAKLLTDLPTSLDALAKGYIVDRAALCARSVVGVTQVLVNIGGDLCHHGERAVAVAISDPFAPSENEAPVTMLHIRNVALATSGGYRRSSIVNGRRGSHILDPRTGTSAEAIVSASVFAGDCMTADALSTAFSVMNAKESIALADSLPGVGCLLIETDGSMTSNTMWDTAATSPSIHTAFKRN